MATKNSIETKKKNKIVTTITQEQIVQRKIHKPVVRLDYKKSPKTGQSNKISAWLWLSKDEHRDICSNSRSENGGGLKKFKENNEKIIELRTEKNKKSSRYSKHTLNKKKHMSKEKNIEGSKENFTTKENVPTSIKQKNKSNENVELRTKRRKLHLDSSIKKTEYKRSKNDEYQKDAKQLNTECRIKKCKSDDKMKKVGKMRDKDSSKKNDRYKTVTEDKSHHIHKKQKKLNDFFKNSTKQDKVSKKTKFSRSESSETCDFPSFKNSNKKPKASKSNESFKKYGVTLPSIEEILKEKKELEKYKNQIEAFQDIDLESFDLSFSVTDNINRTETNSTAVLGCKHLTTDEITQAVKNNLTYISDIFNGKMYNERHNRFFDNQNRNYTLTMKDLTYSTSVIVFSYEQKEHMIKLLKDEFDPNDTRTQYFFQVLLPELCLKIFMDIHEMTYEEAVKYLDVRPITDD